jgi:hypothetical protein
MSYASILMTMRSELLRHLENQIARNLAGETLTEKNASPIVDIVKSTIKDPMDILRELIAYAFSSKESLDTLAGAYDEKEFWIRIFLHQTETFSLRLHIWLPQRPERENIETAHSHRRYLVSYLLNNLYTSYEFQRASGKKIELTQTRTVPAGECYIISPETIHAIGNQTPHHTVSLIVRGNAVTDHIEFFDSKTHELVEFTQQRPIGDLGKTAAEQAMDRKDYLAYRLEKLAKECHLA